MARTRNRHLIENNNSNTENKALVWKAGVYTRISVDVHGEKRESLETQKLVALSYLQEHTDIELVKIYEDDGISGTKFDRDSFLRMLDDIKSKEINTVIVKDLSRFGRNLEEVSKYLEKIFPFLQVRFISINDNYDSISPECDNRMLAIMIANLANDMYAKDASIKMTGTMQIKMEKGNYCGGDAPYGYKRSKNNEGIFVTEIDHLSAPYVRIIFQKLASGISYSSIAKEFNDMLLSCPRHYARTGKLFLDEINEAKSHWCATTIRRIAENRHYLGNNYTHKTRTSLITGEKNTLLDKTEWKEHLNTHEALIDQSLFDEVQKIIIHRRNAAKKHKDYSDYPVTGKKDNIYAGILYCGECGARMTRHNRRSKHENSLNYKYKYLCGNYVSVSIKKYSSNTWNDEVIDELVYNSIVKQAQLVKDVYAQIRDFIDTQYEPLIRYLNKEESKVVLLKQKNEARRMEIYEKYVLAEINNEEYREIIQNIEYMTIELEKRIVELDKSKKRAEGIKNNDYIWMKKFLNHKLTSITREIVECYVERITLYEDNRMEIQFKFQDELLILAKEVEEELIKCKLINV